MAGMIEELISVLEKQVECYEFLYGLSEEKRQSIIKNDINELQKITGLENTLITENVTLDKKRSELMKDIEMVLNLKKNPVTLSDVAAAIDGKPSHDRFAEVSKAIRETVTKLKESNDRNRALIDNSLEYIEYTMNYIHSSINGDVTYSAEPHDNKGMFDTRQ